MEILWLKSVLKTFACFPKKYIFLPFIVKKLPFIENKSNFGVLCIYFVSETKRNTDIKVKRTKIINV